MVPTPNLKLFMITKLQREKLIKAPPIRGFIHSTSIEFNIPFLIDCATLTLGTFNASKFDLPRFHNISSNKISIKDALMKLMIIIIALSLNFGFSWSGFSEEPKLTPEAALKLESEVQLIIVDQIEAFIAFDVDRAYRHASKSIKSIFPNSKVFGDMVQKSYPMIWSPKSYEFLNTSTAANTIVQRVLFTDNQGGMHLFDYALENNDMRWVISGVYFVQGETGA
mgnify:CR=1 FL=1